MARLATLRLLMLVTLLLWSMATESWAANEKELQHQWLYNITTYPLYDAAVRPVPDSSGGPVQVEIDTVMVSVGPINAMDMTWTTSFYLRQQWTDPRLKLSKTTNSTNTNTTTIPAGSPDGHQKTTAKLGYQEVKRIWVPDLFFTNSKMDRKHDVTVPNHLVYIDILTGTVLYSQRLTVELHCVMNLGKFPHDTQECDLKIESYGFSTDDMVLKWSSSRSATNLLPTAFLPDFSITGIDTLDCTTSYAIGTYPCLKATVTLKREIGYYITQNYIPTVLIVVLSWASFWIDHEAVPARISVGLLTVLTITTQLSGSRAQLPKVPYIKAIDVWMSLCLVFVFVAYMEYAVVTVLSRRYKKKQAGRRSRSIFKFPTRSRNTSQASINDLETGTNNDGNNENGDPHPQPESSHQADDVESGFKSSSLSSPLSSKSQLYIKEQNSQSLTPGSTPEKTLPTSKVDSLDTGRMVDKLSRIMFPLAFVIFNAVYWVYYIVIA